MISGIESPKLAALRIRGYTVSVNPWIQSSSVKAFLGYSSHSLNVVLRLSKSLGILHYLFNICCFGNLLMKGTDYWVYHTCSILHSSIYRSITMICFVKIVNFSCATCMRIYILKQPCSFMSLNLWIYVTLLSSRNGCKYIYKDLCTRVFIDTYKLITITCILLWQTPAVSPVQTEIRNN